MNKNTTLAVVTLAAANLLALPVIARADADLNKHGHLKAAHEMLHHAEEQLAKANDKKKTEFGGHRANAVNLIHQAQAEIEAAAVYADNPANQ